MSTESKGIYHWKLGDVALARLCQKTYARVRVVKDEKGLFYDDKVLGISGNEDGSITVTKELCYYVETCRTNHKFWLPYTSLHLAERSRPFYGTEKVVNKAELVKTEVSPNKTPAMPRKRNVKEEHVVPIDALLSKHKDPDLNTTYDNQHICTTHEKLENAFRAFIRSGKELLFDQYFEIIRLNQEENKNLDYLLNVNASTEDKLEFVIKTTMTEKEIDNYFSQCWKYNLVMLEESSDEEFEETRQEFTDNTNTESPIKDAVTIHTAWCLVCGKPEKLIDCVRCPAAYHQHCRRKWLVTVIHRKNLPKKVPKPKKSIEKTLSSTRTKCTIDDDKENTENVCPSCLWGPQVGYGDIVWNKLGTCSWWPARVLSPGEVPSCLLAKIHTPNEWPLRYYGTQNHSWGTQHRTCLFLPSHTGALDDDTDLKQAVMEANDDYIAVYLT